MSIKIICPASLMQLRKINIDRETIANRQPLSARRVEACCIHQVNLIFLLPDSRSVIQNGYSRIPARYMAERRGCLRASMSIFGADGQLDNECVHQYNFNEFTP